MTDNQASRRDTLNALADRVGRASGLHEKLANCHPSLQRRQVWCRACGYTERVRSAYAFKHGWPKHCGATMTIDHPDTWSATQ